MLTSSDVIASDLEYIGRAARGEFESLAGSSVLLTGGAGFLGYYLTHAIFHWNRSHSRADGVRLTVLDNFSRGVPDWIEELRADERLTLRRHDITQPLPAGCRPANFIIHAASIASPTYYRQHPIETMDANVNGLRNLLDFWLGQPPAARRGFLFFSSSEVYGNPTPDAIPTPETYAGNVSFTGSRACYDESKRYGETLSVNFARVPIRADCHPHRRFSAFHSCAIFSETSLIDGRLLIGSNGKFVGMA